MFKTKERGYYDSKISRTIIMKTWICHTAFNIQKLLNWLTGTAHWLNDPAPPCGSNEEFSDETRPEPKVADSSECMNQAYDVEFVDMTREHIRNICMVLVVASCLLDIAIFKWRNLVHYCILLELFHYALFMMVPNEETTYSFMLI